MKTTGHNLYLSIFLASWCFPFAWTASKCSFSPSTGSLSCSVSQLGDVAQAQDSDRRTRNIRIVCSGHQNSDHHQDRVRQNQFGHLPHLQKLEVEMCSDLDIQRGAFEGLEKLKTLKVVSWQKIIFIKLFI